MQLKELNLTNYRSFVETSIPFDQPLSVLIGENNSGKSNAIDAIRLLTSPLGGRREIYCEPTDIREGSSTRSFAISGVFSPLSTPQQARFISAVVDDDLSEIEIGLSYELTDKISRSRPTIWSGRHKTPPEAGCLDLIRHVYLPPLRDAKRGLASGNPTRFLTLLEHFLGGRDPQELAKELARPSKEEILKAIGGAVNVSLASLTAGVRRQTAEIGFNTDQGLIQIARDLRFKLADHGVKPEDLDRSGLGFANLLYLATIAVELSKVDDAELTLFLVEEPEAHLHPQLQSAVLQFLEECAEKSFKKPCDGHEPAGHIQVIVATHSPNLSAWVESRRLVFLKSGHFGNAASQENESLTQEHSKLEEEGSTEEDGQEVTEGVEGPVEESHDELRRRETRCVPLSRLDLTDEERRKIDRYLDVTKSGMLFGGRVLLVEGIAESLLIPVFARKFIFADDPASLQVFRSSLIIPIEGVDFEPYAKALLSSYEDAQITDKLVIITDGDRTIKDGKVKNPGQERKQKLEELAAELNADTLCKVFTNTYSLESELFLAGNAAIIKSTFLEFHSKSQNQWDSAVKKSGDKRAIAIQKLFKNTRKGDFAQKLAGEILADKAFKVPQYISDAVEELVT